LVGLTKLKARSAPVRTHVTRRYRLLPGTWELLVTGGNAVGKYLKIQEIALPVQENRLTVTY
jgi:hypothetical protein